MCAFSHLRVVINSDIIQSLTYYILPSCNSCWMFWQKVDVIDKLQLCVGPLVKSKSGYKFILTAIEFATTVVVFLLIEWGSICLKKWLWNLLKLFSLIYWPTFCHLIWSGIKFSVSNSATNIHKFCYLSCVNFSLSPWEYKQSTWKVPFNSQSGTKKDHL